MGWFGTQWVLFLNFIFLLDPLITNGTQFTIYRGESLCTPDLALAGHIHPHTDLTLVGPSRFITRGTERLHDASKIHPKLGMFQSQQQHRNPYLNKDHKNFFCSLFFCLCSVFRTGFCFVVGNWSKGFQKFHFVPKRISFFHRQPFFKHKHGLLSFQ